MNETKEKKRGIGALDVLIIILVVAVLGNAGLRFWRSRRAAASEQAQLGNFTIQFTVRNIRDSSAKDYLTEGTVFYLDENNQVFGTVDQNFNSDYASRYYETKDGQIILVKSEIENDLKRVDVMRSVTAKGCYDSDNRFLLNGVTYLALNREVSIHSKYVSYTVLVTGISNSANSEAE